MAFLEIITRTCPGRDGMLLKNQRSLGLLESPDWIQTVLRDEIGQGIGWAQAQLAEFKPGGEYVWILDDDDRCTRPTLIAELKQVVDKHDPDVIMVKMDHGLRGVLPDASGWGKAPRMGNIGCSAYVVRRSVWLRHANAWTGAHYASDFDFIYSIWLDDVTVFWLDVVASKIQKISMGLPG